MPTQSVPSREEVTDTPTGNGRSSRAPVNAGHRWDEFDPDAYLAKNYLEFGEDDRRILQVARNFFIKVFGNRSVERGIDVGSGANLYPALAMLPFCNEITLWERGLRNFHWLSKETVGYSACWDPYWDELALRPPYRTIDKPRVVLQERTLVERGDLYYLKSRQWDVGTMFFVAESISDAPREFALATRCFVNSLKLGAPFVAAFMRDSTGYDVGGLSFPAVAVSEGDVRKCLSTLAHEVEIVPIRSVNRRDGYDGMILALGKAGAPLADEGGGSLRHEDSATARALGDLASFGPVRIRGRRMGVGRAIRAKLDQRRRTASLPDGSGHRDSKLQARYSR
jgi:hypothetical protein